MSDNFSLLDSSFNNDPLLYNEPTLFEMIEQEDKKHSNFLNNYDEKEAKIFTDFTSKYPLNYRKENTLIEIENTSLNDINNLQNIFSINLQSPILSSPQEDKAEKIQKNDYSDVNDNKKQKEIKLIGKKRKLKEKEIVKTKEDIFEEIKKLFNNYNKKYNKNKEIIPSYKIFEGFDCSVKKYATIVENKIPGCVIYFEKNAITNMYLIREQITLKKENEIIEVLNIIKNNLKNICL